MKSKEPKALILGSGRSDKIGHWTGMEGTFQDNYLSVTTVDINPDVRPDIIHDLTSTPWPVGWGYDAIHAYEVMEHVTRAGDYKGFFAIWSEVWLALAHGGKFYGTTPWWQSHWAYSDPGHTQIYTPSLLRYLDKGFYEQEQATEYRHLWRHSLELIGSWQIESPSVEKAGYAFILRKS